MLFGEILGQGIVARQIQYNKADAVDAQYPGCCPAFPGVSFGGHGQGGNAHLGRQVVKRVEKGLLQPILERAMEEQVAPQHGQRGIEQRGARSEERRVGKECRL